ncbi:MAG: HesA/MoeB/ThiF family protein [Planctomycetota bacterium]|jgi:molybdopterin/thiamine biosynthesis adenylyltransferase
MLTEEQTVTLVGALEPETLNVLTLDHARTLAVKLNLPLRCIEWFALDRGVTVARYQSNILTLGLPDQKRLLESSVLIVGLGGLGGYVLEELARAGVGKIVCADRDIFDETNLNRQLLATCQSLGKRKATQAAERAKMINEAVEFTAVPGEFAEIPSKLWQGVDVAFDCLDNVPDRLMLAEHCSAAGVPLVHGAVGAWCGQVGVIWPGSGTLERLYRSGRHNIRQAGVLPCTAATAASLMVAEGIGVLLGRRNEGNRKILFFDLLENEWHTIAFGTEDPIRPVKREEDQ